MVSGWRRAAVSWLLLAVVAQLVERNLAKVEVAGSSPVYRSTRRTIRRRTSASRAACVPGRVRVLWRQPVG